LSADAELVRAALQRQVEARQTRLVAPYGADGPPDDPARLRDLRLARTAIRQFHAARLGEPGRELWLGVRVSAATLADPLARAGLVSVYALLDADGFLVEAEGADEELLAELVFALELQSGRRVDAPLDRDSLAARRAQQRVLKRAVSA
jgi:hypothetical protein